jgi:hypothetical protein
MISQTELKTLVPSLVMSGVLLYEAITGNAVSEHMQGELVNGILIGAGYMVTLWGIWKNHQKATVKNSPSIAPQLTPAETEPPKIPPDQGAINIEETQPTQTPIPTTPIVTQTDLNKQIGG